MTIAKRAPQFFDVKRAGDELGMGKDERAGLKTLAPGEFYVYGPAIANAVQIVRTGDVTTSHPEAGKVGAAPPAAPAKVRAMLAQLVDLPKEAEQEARTLEDFKRQNAELARKLRAAEKHGTVVEKPVTVIDQKAIERAVAAAVKPYGDRMTTIKRAVSKVVVAGRSFVDVLGSLESIDFDVAATNGNGNGHGNGHHADATKAPGRATIASVRATNPAPRAISRGTGDSSLAKGERIVLNAIAQYPEGVERDQLTVLTGYKRSTRDAYIQRLQTAGRVTVDGASITATDDGIAALGDSFEPLPTGEALREYWLNRLPEGEARVLSVVLAGNGEAVDRDAITDESGYKRSTRDAYIQRLTARRLVESAGKDGVRASATLFEES